MLSAVLPLTLSVWVAAIDLTGAWTLSLDPDFQGNKSAVHCDLAHRGQDLTLECDELGVSSGTIDHHVVKFVFMTGQDGLLPAKFTGVLAPDEASITGTWRLEDVGGNRIGRFSASKK